MTACMVLQITDDPPSLYLDCTRHFTSIIVHTTHLRHHTVITLQVVPKTKYMLRLLVNNEERELWQINNQAWEPALVPECCVVLCTVRPAEKWVVSLMSPQPTH